MVRRAWNVSVATPAGRRRARGSRDRFAGRGKPDRTGASRIRAARIAPLADAAVRRHVPAAPEARRLGRTRPAVRRARGARERGGGCVSATDGRALRVRALGIAPALLPRSGGGGRTPGWRTWRLAQSVRRHAVAAPGVGRFAQRSVHLVGPGGKAGQLVHDHVLGAQGGQTLEGVFVDAHVGQTAFHAGAVTVRIVGVLLRGLLRRGVRDFPWPSPGRNCHRRDSGLQSGQCREQRAPARRSPTRDRPHCLRTVNFPLDRTARPRGSAMRSSSIKVPSRLPSNSKASSAPNPFPLAPDALVTRRAIAIVLRDPQPRQASLCRCSMTRSTLVA